MIIVLDTNVLISSLINPQGLPASIINLVLNGDIQLVFDNRIMDEYRNVLARKKFNFQVKNYEPLLDFIRENGIYILAKPIHTLFRDADDKAFYEVALSGNADYLVTGNIKNFPKEIFIVTPTDFIQKI